MQATQQSLYDPRDERDSCGFGLIAQLDDRPSRALVDRALEALSRMTHRGGVAADGLSGDGCGLLIRHPDAFLRLIAREANIRPGPHFAAGLVFLPHDATQAGVARDTLNETLRSEGMRVTGWRVVPVNLDACGDLARKTMPRIEQIFVDAAAPFDPAGFQRSLFLARRRAEQRLRAIKDFYVVSLSSASIGYKGMVLPDRLMQLYPDLQRAELAASAVVFHQRFSTNTTPRWPLAQPFRLLAHNGEINTIAGNRAWAQARAYTWRTPTLDLREFDQVVSTDGSDSQSLDNMLEVLQAGGMDLLKAMRILIPPATQSLEYKDADLAAFYEYYALNTEPWDGPAGIVTCDGRYAACTLDRNGLRPARWLRSRDRHFLIASEAGVWELPVEEIEAKGKLGPGEMIAADLYQGELLDSEAIDRINRARAPYKRWLKQGMTYLHSELIDPNLAAEPFDHETLAGFQKLFQLTREEREQVLRPLAEIEQEATGSMGDDVPMAVLSQQVRPLYDHFRQAFAQVTNPPMDPLREDCVMSLATQIGREGNVFVDGPGNVGHIHLNSPVLAQRKLRQLLSMAPYDQSHHYIDLNYTAAEGLKAALLRLCAQTEQATRDGNVLLIVTDRRPRRDALMMHALLATGAIHQHLTRVGLRCEANLIIETGTARDPHHFACLIGFGATAVYPYLAYQTLHDLGARGILRTKHGEAAQIGRSYRRAIKKGLLKIISKMGIATIGSYRGAQLFEIIGLDKEVVDMCFTGAPSRIAGAGFELLQQDNQTLADIGWDANRLPEIGGLLKYTPGGEYHLFNPDVVTRLQRAVASGEWSDWQHYAEAVNERPTAALRDLLELNADPAKAIPIEEVEPVADIVRRFDSAAMSLGALSPEAHEALAIAMNRLGGRSNSGEGGEDPARYRSDKVSKIKQIASGRFGVTPEYLVNAEVLQIKIAQGAKPGEGGQLPGHKVNELIARLRYAMPGIGLISPPPHHDIYSIEDLAQLIHDLRQVNPQALISVKLVSHAGVGTIATGVAKAGADLVTVSGHDGGTGASPLSSIRYAGTPWELGLAEARQALIANDLRDRVILQTDGGLKSGLDVIKAALLGAESFGFGTAPMIALGCKYLRICHLNNCATGVATQDAGLRRDHFTGLPERVENFFRLLAEEVRHWLASMGVRTLGEIVGRTDLLKQSEGDSARQQRLDLSPLLAGSGLAHGGHCGMPAPAAEPDGLSAQLEAELAEVIANKSGGDFSYKIRNTDRSIGARLSGRIARAHGDRGMNDAPITLRFNGTAGQSFGAFQAGGLHFELSGEANDYVGKGMAGGRIVLRPPAGARYVANETPILGNTCLYGATGGELYAAGRAGERFGVRNSGATAVVEGAGDHCCEYMTGGVVAVLGRTGLNFGAGFTGGMAYVLDVDRDFVDRYNHELIDILRISADGFEHHRSHLHDLLETHVALTGSVWARRILDEMRDYLGKFWLVKPKAASLESLAETLRSAA
ncbi:MULTISPECIES: glutamate synthase large subunit [Lysobacter]|uniref:glutamate synthase large subunit n=1 Tax=Lysobacter TaxID=68 RepID=UPI001F2BD7EB|nr:MULTISPECIES: glutamate synthase large subunit [Lysobacter]UJB19327.1 glutamate synthase large subunit [Lysobacter capsici]UJQ26948.1 glutamate synthase large subunit [Lysobacter gummosus]